MKSLIKADVWLARKDTIKNMMFPPIVISNAIPIIVNLAKEQRLIAFSVLTDSTSMTNPRANA
jgi:hypothetical protein